MKIVSEKEEIGCGVIAKVVSQTGYCGAGHKVGDEVKFIGHSVEGKVCIHALCSMLSRVYAFRFDATIPWLEDPDRWHCACPDPHNPVVFQLSRLRD